MNFLRVVRSFLQNKSFKRAKFLWYDLDIEVSKFDDDMLLAQLGYYGHHTEKALKHHNRGNRGQQKRDKLELLVNEIEKRNIEELKVINWAKHLVEYFDTNQDIYIKKIDEVREHENKDQILNFIRDRTTTRFWQQKEVDDKIIENILETAMSSSLSCNRQTIRFAVVKNKIENMIVGDSNNKSMFDKAPVIIYVADDERFFPEKYGNALDVGGVCSLIQLAASVYGISSTWMYYADFYNQKEVQKQLGLKEYMYVYSVVALGYPLDIQEKPPRYNIKKFIINKVK